MPIVSGGSGSGAVTSVFTRTGAVVAAANDYNYSQIANSANAVAVTNIAAGTAGQVLGGTGPSYALPPGFEINYTQITANVTVSGTSGARTTVISPGAITFDGSAVLVHFFAQAISSGAADQVSVTIDESGSIVAVLSQTGSPSANEPCSAFLRFTPTAASHTYTISAYRATANGIINAGTGSGGANAPAFVRFTKV